MKRLLLVFFALVALLVAVALVLSRLGVIRIPGTNATPQPTVKPTAALIVDPNIGASPTPAPAEPGVAIPGWGGIRLPTGQTEAPVSLYNPEDNADWYYLTFQLRMKDSGEVLFSTGLIPPGMYCTKVELTRPLETGTYAGIMHVQPYYMRDPPTPTNNADFDIQIHVLP